MKLRSWTIFALTAMAACGGCAHYEPPPSRGYFGPTATMSEVIAGVNRNNERIPTLWAHQKFSAHIVDRQKSQARDVDGYGVLQYAAPNELRLSAKNEFATFFDVGSDGEKFWLQLPQEGNTFWWGHFANIGKPCCDYIPLRPDLILAVLGVQSENTFFLQEPAPVMRFNNDADAYMIVWQQRQGDHWAATREVWYDRSTLHPIRVLLFDPNGRVLLVARLSDFQPVQADDGDKSQWPVAATAYQLFFPDTGTKMVFKLSDVALNHGGYPKPISFKMPDPERLREAGVKVHQIDERCAP